MKLSSIWTFPAIPLKERMRRTADWVDMEIAARLPKRVKYWVFVLVGAKAIGNDVVPDANYMELLERVPGRPRS